MDPVEEVKNIKKINMKIPIYKPYLPKKSLKYVKDAINSGWLSSHGDYLDKVEEKLKEITGSNYVLLTNNGTSATHLLACALKFKYPLIDDIIVPSNVYIAALNMFQVNPIFKLHPIDADLDTWNMDISKIPNLNTPYFQKFSAILSIPNIGNPTNIEKTYTDVPIVEDNCEGFLSKDTGKGFAYSVSFFGNKTLTSGEGGAFFTDDIEIAHQMNRVRCQGATHEKFIFSGLGYNYRMTNVEAAILYGQLEVKDEILQRKQENFEFYRKNLEHPDIFFQRGQNQANWMFGIRVNRSKKEVDELKETLEDCNIEIRPMFPPINMHSHYSQFGDIFPVSKQLYEQVIILPSYPELTKNEILYISKVIKNNL